MGEARTVQAPGAAAIETELRIDDLFRVHEGNSRIGAMGIGLYRETDGWGNEESARVRYPDGSELDVPRNEYEAADHEPSFDELPTKVEYEAHHA